MNEEANILDVSNVKEQALPSMLTSQFDKLSILEKNVKKTLNMAEEAKKKAENAEVKVGFFDHSKKEAIALLQTASKGLAEGLFIAAEAQNVSFEYQTKLTEITKVLFGIGLSNLAMNRSIVRELELKLKGASEEEISDLAKQELRNVIMQLKNQEDMMQKHSKLVNKMKEHQYQFERIEEQLDHIKNLNEEQANTLAFYSEKILKYDKYFEEQQKNNCSINQVISRNENKLNGLENSLKQQEETVIDLSYKINSAEKKLINIIDALKEERSNQDKEIYNKITDINRRIDSLDVITSKLGWKIGISIVAIVALIINVLQICGII